MCDAVNMTRLREASLDDAEFMGELVEMFLTDVPDQLVSLERAVASEDWYSTSRAAHRLRGACSNIGAEELARLCSEVEQSTAQAIGVDRSLCVGIREEFDRVTSALQDCVLQAKREGG